MGRRVPLIIDPTDLSSVGSPDLDAFGRLRTSDNSTIFDSKQIFDNAPLTWDDAQTSGSGTNSTHSTALAASTMTVSALTAGTRVRQTKRWFNYQPGKSQLIMMTGVFGTGTSGITKRVGLFETNNGLYFQQSGSTVSVVVRSSTSGSVVNTVINQTSWNIDKLDGTGSSGITLDLSLAQIFVIDFEWLGTGRVRFGFNIEGRIYYVHQHLTANTRSTVYMSSPNLPLRYEISNDSTGAADSLIHICSTVLSEGGQEERGLILSASTGNTQLDANTAGTIYAAIGIKLRSTHLGTTIKLISMSIISGNSGDPFEWQLVLNPTVAGTFTYSNLTNSACQTALGATANTVTGGTLLSSGFSQTQAEITIELNSDITVIGSTIAGVIDSLVLCIRPIAAAADADIYASMIWREVF